MPVYLKIYSWVYLQLLKFRRFIVITCLMRKTKQKFKVIRELYDELAKAFGEEKAMKIFEVNEPTGIMLRIGKRMPVSRRDFNSCFRSYRPECFIYPPHIGSPWVMEEDYGKTWRLKKFLVENMLSFEKLDPSESSHDHIKTRMLITLIRWHDWSGYQKAERNGNGCRKHYFSVKKGDFGLVIPPILTPDILDEELKWFKPEITVSSSSS